ncbi:MAG: hypothetical protein IPM75_12350 [Candidatus Competibacteraceae bacterium]|nr:hypothetical protein [Candidatus Competibacteraceae bacterium]
MSATILMPLKRLPHRFLPDDANPSASAAAAPAAPPSAPKPVRLEKITWTKAQSQHFTGEEGPGLRRNRGQSERFQDSGGGAKGLFRGRLTGGRKIDLDRLPVQAARRPGRRGAGAGREFRQPAPAALHIQLLGDDRSGASARGEFPAHQRPILERVDRVVLFAMIYEGAPNWAETDAVVTPSGPGQPMLKSRIDSHRNDQRHVRLGAAGETGRQPQGSLIWSNIFRIIGSWTKLRFPACAGWQGSKD